LRSRQVELIAAIFARMRGDEFDRTGDEDAEYLAGLRATVEAALEYVLAGIERGEEGIGPVPMVASEQARRAARVGVPLDTVLRRYVVGSALLGEFIMEEADLGNYPGERSALRGALRAQASGLDRLLQTITGAYGDEVARVRRSPERRRSERVKRLLGGSEVIGQPELDYDLEGWHIGAIAVGERAGQAVRELAASMDRRLLWVPQGEQSVWAWLSGRERSAFGDVERIVSGVVAPQSVLPPEGVVLALGEPAHGIEGWRLTHQEAQAALVVALRRPQAGAVTRYADVALLAAALKDEMLARSLIDIYIAPVEDSRNSGQVLRETLRAYLAAERSVSSTATALGVARKTVEKRLRTIEERLGRTLHPCPAELEVALLLDELATVSQQPEF
jgi:hypothetical protein